MNQEYTIIIRKTEHSYIALCMEMNICSMGETLKETKQNLKDAIALYLEDVESNPETILEPISIHEFIEFLKDTELENQPENSNNYFKTFEINSLPAYV